MRWRQTQRSPTRQKCEAKTEKRRKRKQVAESPGKIWIAAELGMSGDGYKTWKKGWGVTTLCYLTCICADHFNDDGHMGPELLGPASHEKNQPDVEQEFAGCNMCSAITQHVCDVGMSGVE